MQRAQPQIAPTGLSDRIKAVCALLGDRGSAAVVAGLSTDQLDRYTTGKSQPAFAPVARLAMAAEVRMEWIWTGEGAMRQDEPIHTTSVTREDHFKTAVTMAAEDAFGQDPAKRMAEAAWRAYLALADGNSPERIRGLITAFRELLKRERESGVR